jgi:hypothetical protein
VPPLDDRGHLRFARLIAIVAIALSSHAAEVARSGAHVFYSSFWINLHERLRHEAMAKTPEPHELTAAEREAWDAALATYKTDVAPKDAISSNDLVEWTRALSLSADASEPKGVPDNIAAALRRAAPVYRKHAWITDDRTNRFSIAIATTLLREAGAEITKDIERWYGITWPKSLHFEVTSFVEPFGANTPPGTPDLLLTVMSTSDPAYQGFNVLEMCFHEPLHHFDQQMQAAISAASKETGVRSPRGFSHALLFYTTGEATRRALAARFIMYKPVAQAVIARAWPALAPLLEQHWQAYLDSKITRDDALRKILLAAK